MPRTRAKSNKNQELHAPSGLSKRPANWACSRKTRSTETASAATTRAVWRCPSTSATKTTIQTQSTAFITAGQPPREVPARRARAAQVQPGGQGDHAGNLLPGGAVVLHGDRVFVRVAGHPAVQEGGDHVLFPLVPVVAGQQPQHPPVPLLQVQVAAHPAASAPAWPSLARTTRAAA